MKNKIIAIICIFVFVGTITGEMRISATDEQKKEFVAGKMHLAGLAFPEDTVIQNSHIGRCFSLNNFFESIGGVVSYDKETENAKVEYLNERYEIEIKDKNSEYSKFLIKTEKNNVNVHNGFGDRRIQLSSMTGSGECVIQDDNIYIGGVAFEYLLNYLGYNIETNSVTRDVEIFPRTMNLNKGQFFADVEIEKERFAVTSLADGTWYGYKPIYLENDFKRENWILIDEEGRIYKKTDYVMKAPTTSVSSNKTTPIIHNVDTMDEAWQEGTAYFYNLKFPEGTVLYDTPKGTLIYLRSFFEGIGSEVIYDEETKDVKINHINQELLWEKSEEENTFTIRRSVNPSNVKTDSADGYFNLGDEEVEGWYTRIDGRTYMDLESFKRMVSYLGYQVEDNPEVKELRISPITLLNWDTVSNQPTFENVIDGKRYYLSPLSDGSWIGRMKNNSRSVAYVDGEGQVYELTNQAVDGSLADKNRS